MTVSLRIGDETVATRLRGALIEAGYAIGDDGTVVIVSMDTIRDIREKFPAAAVLAVLPDTLDVRATFTIRDAFDSVIPLSMLSPAALRVAIDRAKSLREAQAKQTLVDLASDGMALVSKTGMTLYVNPAFERILGRAASEIVGRPATIFTHPEDISSGKPPPAGGTSTRLGRSLHKDGSYRWLESVIRDCTNDPSVGAYVVTFRDVTQHREVERAALVTQRRLEYLLSSTRAVTYSCEPHGAYRCTFMSESVRDVLGWDAREFMRDPRFWADRIHPEDRDRVFAEVEHTVAGGAGMLEYRFKHADGTWRWMQDELRIFPTADGRELIGYWIDVTERKAADETLRRSEANFRSLIESSPVATFVHRDSTIVYANQACAAMLGYGSARELIGMDGMSIVHPADRGLVRGHVDETSAARSTTPTEVRLLRKDGSIVMAEGHGVLLDFDGVPSHVVMNRDVTERRMLFERAAAGERMRAVGAVAAGVAHEINAPLGFVANALALLERDKTLSTDTAALVADAMTGARRIESITASLRTMSHAREETFEPVDVVASMKLALKMLSPELRGRRVHETYDGDLPPVRAQQHRLGQVFVNIVLNAAQAMREQTDGEISIHARLSGGNVIVCVGDTGPGMTQSARERVFEPFFTTKPAGTGTGLGLAISRSIVTSFGGSLALDPASERGTSFTITLPVAARPSKLRILLVDDDPAFVKTLRIMLESDHDVLGTTNAGEAVAMIEGGRRFDAILCDMTMPAMTGIQFHQRVESLAREQARRIVFISGGTDPALRQTGRTHLQKPFKAEELANVLAGIPAYPA